MFDVKQIPLQLIAFLTTGFLVGAVSDIVLNDLSTFKQSGEIITSLRSYFEKRTILFASFSAAMTILVAMILVSIVFSIITGSFYPRTLMEFIIYCAIGYPLGYLMDVLIYKMKVFGTDLDPYYEIAGAGHWGALSLMFAVVPSFLVTQGITLFHSDIQAVMCKATRMASNSL